MTVGRCAALAAEWVEKRERPLEGFVGAYIGGSSAGLGDGETVPEGSDMDVYVVLDGQIPEKRGKFVYEGALIEISYISSAAIEPAELSLRDYHLANSLRWKRTLADTNGRLSKLQSEVAEKFHKREYIEMRRDHALSRVENGLKGIKTDAPLPAFTLGWLFPTGITAHAVLVAALKNPTVRLRYLAAKRALDELKMGDFYEELISVSGFGGMTAARAERHLKALERVYDAASALNCTKFFFCSDVSPQSRATAIDASRELIKGGYPRETMFWTLGTYCRALMMLEADAPEDVKNYMDDFTALIEDAGRPTREAALEKARKVLEFSPKLREKTDIIINITAKK